MAQMIPAECDLSRRPVSEQIVFAAIKENLSHEWKVFHAFDYISRDLNYNMFDGEIDFLLYHPERGFLIIEVKGGMISYRDGIWYQEDRQIDPVNQARRNKYALRELFAEKLCKALHLNFAHAVCFPSCDSQYIWPAEARDIVLTKDTLPNIEKFAKTLLKKAPRVDPEQDIASEAEIMQILSPMFEYGNKLSQRMDDEENQFFMFTEQQCAILDALEQFKRLQICGCAGSGKTIMAIKKANRLAAQNKKVLLLCFNQMLAKYLKKSVKNEPLITVSSFHAYCIELLKISDEQIAPYKNDARLYNETLPKLLKEYIAKHCLYYDAVIVDEGQDFTKEIWDAISLLPEVDGHFYIFYDPDQNIYTNELQLPDFGIPPVVLNKNCRNTKRIFNALQPYRSTPSEPMPNAPLGADVHVLHGNSRKNLEKELHRLVIGEKIHLKDIVILGAHSLQNTSLGNNPNVGKFHIVSTDQPLQQYQINYFTYMKYKGCESKVVILLDVDNNDPRWNNRHGIYTAMSRAIHELIVIYK